MRRTVGVIATTMLSLGTSLTSRASWPARTARSVFWNHRVGRHLMATKPHEEWPVARVRSTFVNFFASKHKHTPFPSSPVVPYDDPTLLFANAVRLPSLCGERARGARACLQLLGDGLRAGRE